jgi:hypothetical protein
VALEAGESSRATEAIGKSNEEQRKSHGQARDRQKKAKRQ